MHFRSTDLQVLPLFPRHWLRIITALTPAALTAAFTILFAHPEHTAVYSQERRAPNIVLILADDLGYGDLSCYGHPQFKTPQLDRLAAEGARLTQFQSPAAFCAPTRAALLTGRYPFRCGMTANPAPDGGPQADAVALPASEVTLAELLQRAGYATGMVGKWHLGHQRLEHYPTRRGFQEYLGILYSNDMRPVQLIEGERVIEYPLVQATLTQRYTDRAVDFIERNRARPFFLYLAHAMPHKPLAVSEKYYHQSQAGLYGDVLMELDACLGRLFAKLQELDLDSRTLVIFTSDNGPWYGGSTGGLRGMKGSTFEGGFRVPLIARWPGRIPAGHVQATPAVMMDVFATVLSAAGIEAPQDRAIDGRDLMPLLTTATTDHHAYILGHAGPRVATIRDARWKLHVLAPGVRKSLAPGDAWVDPRGPDGVTILAPYEQSHPSQFPGLESGDVPVRGMLFDLQADPGEQHNVRDQHPDVARRLRELYDQALADAPASAQAGDGP